MHPLNSLRHEHQTPLGVLAHPVHFCCERDANGARGTIRQPSIQAGILYWLKH
jgi:hypothetical protein